MPPCSPITLILYGYNNNSLPLSRDNAFRIRSVGGNIYDTVRIFT